MWRGLCLSTTLAGLGGGFASRLCCPCQCLRRLDVVVCWRLAVVVGQVVVVVVSTWVPAHGIGVWCWNMVVVSGSGGWCSSELGHSRSDSDMGVGGGGRLGGVVVAPVAPHQGWGVLAQWLGRCLFLGVRWLLWWCRSCRRRSFPAVGLPGFADELSFGLLFRRCPLLRVRWRGFHGGPEASCCGVLRWLCWWCFGRWLVLEVVWSGWAVAGNTPPPCLGPVAAAGCRGP